MGYANGWPVVKFQMPHLWDKTVSKFPANIQSRGWALLELTGALRKEICNIKFARLCTLL